MTVFISLTQVKQSISFKDCLVYEYASQDSHSSTYSVVIYPNHLQEEDLLHAPTAQVFEQVSV